MPDNLNLKQIKENLGLADFRKGRGFDILKELCFTLNEAREDSEEFYLAQEILLRLLEFQSEFEGMHSLVSGLIRRVGLFPYLNSEKLGLDDLLAYEFHRPLKAKEMVFHRAQADVYRLLLEGKSVVLSAPTSFGKSLIIDAIIATQKFNNIVVVVPTIALIDETRKRLSQFKGSYKIITQVYQKKAERNIFIFTQERVVEHPNLGNVDFFVIDEFYKLNPKQEDIQRSVILNIAFYRLMKKARQFYMLGPNIQALPVGFEKKYDCVFYKTDFATVASEIHYMPSRSENSLLDLCRTLNSPTLIFCSSPGRVREVAKLLIEAKNLTRNDNLDDLVHWIGEHYHKDWLFGRALQFGVGMHHARIPRSLGQQVVKEFNNERLRFLICTSTLIEGVNTKAKNVIILDNAIAKKKFDYFTFNNIKGRGGRMSQHFVGHVYIFHDPPQLELPFVDIPVFTQDENVPETLLIQLEDNDLKAGSKDRLKAYANQNLLMLETIRRNVGVDPEAQLRIAEKINEDPMNYENKLNWSQFPTNQQLWDVCDLAWDLFNRKGMFSGVASSKQLYFKINQLRRNHNIQSLIGEEMKNNASKGVDEAIENVLDFLRYWPGFHFPKLLKAVEKIQKDVFKNYGLKGGNYSFFIDQLENFFLPATMTALDEYGLPTQISEKLAKLVNFEQEFEDVVKDLKQLELNKAPLNEFEVKLLKYCLNFLN